MLTDAAQLDLFMNRVLTVRNEFSNSFNDNDNIFR